MILGMNPKELRKPRSWCVFLWFQKQHWSLVLRPEGEPFQVRVVDDFVHNASHFYNAEVPSTRLFLIYEMLVADGKPYLMLSAKTDFDPNYEMVRPLGLVGPVSFENLEQHALGIVRCYKRYSFIGCNCQHFATEFATSLGASQVDSVLTDDQDFIHCASDLAVTVGVAGAAVALTSAAAAAGVAVVTAVQPTAVASVASFTLQSVAASAAGVGLVGSLSLIGMAASYHVLHSSLREQPETYCVSSCSHKDAASSIGHSVGTLMPHSYVAMVGHSTKLALPLADEPEMEPELEHETSSGATKFEDASASAIAEEPESEGQSRVAPWSTAPSWEQPPWNELPERTRSRTF